MQFASKVNDTQSDDDNENNSEETSGENTGPVTKFISISTIGCNNTNVNKSLKIRSESGTKFGSTMSSTSYNNSSLRTNRSKDNDERDNVTGINDNRWTDDGAILVDQSSFLSCSTPLSHRGCNYEDEDEDEEAASNCYEKCENQKNVRIISIENIKSEDIASEHMASLLVHRNSDKKKNITDKNLPPTGVTRVGMKSEYNADLEVKDETK